MERWGDGFSTSPQRLGKSHPSFSSSLLDTIYRSFDETADCVAANERRVGGGRDSFSARKKPSDAYSEHRRTPPLIRTEVTRSGREHWTRNIPFAVTRSGRESRSASVSAATSSSSDVSSYGGFSSSEADTVTAAHPTCLRPIRTSSIGSSTFAARFGLTHPSAVLPPPPPFVTGSEKKKGKKEQQDSIRSRLMRELRKRRAPASPGARLTNFLNSLFHAKSKHPCAAVASGEDSTCSRASSYSRSCLSKTPSSRGKTASVKRTVTFCPTSVIVDKNFCPCDEKLDSSSNRPPPREASPIRRRAEWLRRSTMEQEQEDMESDSSSDLFELENLAVGEQFQDELPVYETTSFSGYIGITRGLLM